MPSESPESLWCAPNCKAAAATSALAAALISRRAVERPRRGLRCALLVRKSRTLRGRIVVVDIEKLKELAQDAKWTGRWYNSGCNTVMCDYDGKDDHDEIAHPVPIGIADYIAAVHPAAVLKLIDELESVTAERDQLREANASRSDKLNEAQSIIDQLRAEVEARRKDAERWRMARRILTVE